ncbi:MULTISPECIES: isopentenyl-diphosphate Delta-isomerase [Sodalis]|jgi:isopentenyl-diphosphate delta-isomerase|uniref:Isopentenyl-diphosphate Delta-isomerase n=1 Tax=Sodalis ligni TaxID=2697027 RepID=A0A4R1N9F5_9GAMM|nr:isopentenyl-diphosphate Delta-isomerase [Sodalis ligni]TCL03883.1 isopentenyl-diphosphate delta-isomerase [Sodalis ligni]
MAFTEVILVDERDQPVGRMEKLKAHREGLLHRAVTVYLFNPEGDLLLQQRAESKYHCGGLWSNTCCGHPMPREETASAAQRRLYEEMGLNCALTPIFTLQYRLPLSNGLVEHELGHVFFGISGQTPKLNPGEAMAYRYQPLTALLAETQRDPALFTPWFLLTLPDIPPYFNEFLRLRHAG